MKPNISYAQFTTISWGGRKITTSLYSCNHLPVTSCYQAMPQTKAQVKDNHEAKSQNEVDITRKLFFKPMVSLPLSGKLSITSDFGKRYHPLLHKETLHAGIDLRADYERVYTVANGIKFICSRGDLIFAGEEIAISGATGAATAPHLHFAIKENGKFIRPLPLLRAIVKFNKISM